MQIKKQCKYDETSKRLNICLYISKTLFKGFLDACRHRNTNNTFSTSERKLHIKLDVAFRTPHCGTKSKHSCYLKSKVPTQSKNVPLNPFLVFSHDLKMILSNWTMKFLQTKPLTIWQFLLLLSIIGPWWCFSLMFFKVGVRIYEGNQ